MESICNCSVCTINHPTIVCSHCHKLNCGDTNNCCITFPYEDKNQIAICIYCFKDIEKKLMPYNEYIAARLVLIKQKIKNRQTRQTLSAH